MTFPNYWKYVEMITTRDHIVLAITICTLIVFGVVLYVRWLRPAWFHAAAYILGVGGFYATLGYWVVYCLTHP